MVFGAGEDGKKQRAGGNHLVIFVTYFAPKPLTSMQNLEKLDYIIQGIAQKTGITHDQARSAFMATFEFIKTKLPDSVGSQMTGLLEGKEFDYNLLLKDQANSLKEQAQDKFEEFKDDAQEKLEELRGKAKGFMDKIL